MQQLCLKSQKEETQQGHSTEHSDFFLFPLLSLPNTDLRYRLKPSPYVLRQVRQDNYLEAVPALLNLLAVSPAKKIHVPSPLESLKCPSPSQTEVLNHVNQIMLALCENSFSRMDTNFQNSLFISMYAILKVIKSCFWGVFK